MAAQYKKCVKTIYEMLEDRKYSNIRTLPEQTKIMACKGDHTIHVYFAKKKGLGVHDIRKILDNFDGGRHENDRVILVCDGRVTYYAKQAIKDYQVQVETFQSKRLFYNVTKHVMVPPHRLLEQHEVDDVLLRYNLHLVQCPKISAEDPVAKYYGAEPGQLMEIQRSSPDGRVYYVYRVVVQDVKI